ncbi:Uncharacterised protein [uncultured archaeon]|nr:Uncharacterised protein [uncultured archaeon]
MLEDEIENDNLKQAFLSYNPENDPNGSIGIALADAAFKVCGYNPNKLQDWLSEDEKSLVSSDNKYTQFYKATEKNRLFPFNVYSDSSVKAKIIKEIIGYTKLRTGKGVSTPIENCASEVIGEVFKRFYQKSLDMQKKSGSH